MKGMLKWCVPASDSCQFAVMLYARFVGASLHYDNYDEHYDNYDSS